MLNSTKYQHRLLDGTSFDLPLGKVVCVGRNYLDHIHELGNEVPAQSILFIKPSTAVCDMQQKLTIPNGQGECHNELELAFLISSELSKASIQEAQQAIAGVGLGLDLTLREQQNKLKSLGHPWERAKAFDGSCPLSPFIAWSTVQTEVSFSFKLFINGEERQHGDSQLMMKPAFELISEISQHFTLQAGDVVLTGTPKGVGPLNHSDEVKAVFEQYFEISTQVSQA